VIVWFDMPVLKDTVCMNLVLTNFSAQTLTTLNLNKNEFWLILGKIRVSKTKTNFVSELFGQNQIWTNLKQTEIGLGDNGSQLYWAFWHNYLVKNVWRHTWVWNKAKMLEMALSLYALTVFKNLAAHQKTVHGTLVRRGTPVEKHWSRGRGNANVNFI